MKRRKTRVVRIGRVSIGGDNPIAIQSMTKTRTSDVRATLDQIRCLEEAGCDIVRLAVNDIQSAAAIKEIKKGTKVPLVADIHFDWRLAIAAIENGIDKIRLNPGNIRDRKELKAIISCAKARGIPIRVGVNSGSVKKTARSTLVKDMVKSALDYVKTIEGLGFKNMVISLKGADISDTVEAYRKISSLCNYPLHLGLTATGLPAQGAISSSIALGILLSEGIGDTIRVSLTAQPQEEVKVAKYILESLGLRNFGPRIISCPTCGRCAVDLAKIVKDLEHSLSNGGHRLSKHTTKVAIMGCAVNGPGEARQADIGIAFEKMGNGVFFKKGKPLYKVSAANCINTLLKEMKE
ncbi:MAG: flavodoxin-dependent (E)-4-hydroxy-3-methylbut-2-enyl-diphosphate synthase [Candidatus Omnitrophica bacterium]|nr:flavodoxin-dependent (E)-4-hydroxy-3-methylbut-2-enyl-diphosphate synthase [Candidatus Omnitrophota bacterium]MDD5610601.1 flavodoxin-dependent (E)-4-hydroxy-3-methylbut-2-enyl-diphosphate synthase [Candidatus Omnitrophota bacterium]